MLLQAMPIVADCDRLTKIVGFDVTQIPGVHGLYVIDNVRKQVYDARTGTQRAHKEKSATIKQLTEAMPPAVEGVSTDEEVIRADLETANAELAAEFARVDTKLTRLSETSNARVEQIRNDADAAIEQLQKQIDDLKENRAKEIAGVQAGLTRNKELAALQKQKVTALHAERCTPLKEQLLLITNNREAVARREQTQKTIETMEVELQMLKEEAEHPTAAIEEIDKYKLELLTNLPVPGIEIVGDKIFRGGVPFERLNTQQRVEIAVEIAKLRPGLLGLICMDGMEVMDEEHYQAFLDRQAMDPNLQFVLARVTNEDFNVRTA
jgi:hypothetical protein